MKKIYLLPVTVAFLLGFVLSSVAQSQPLPGMFVSKERSEHRIREFQLLKNERLRNADGYPDQYFIYTKTAVHDLITKMGNAPGLRLYFARYTPSSSCTLTGNIKNNRLILLWGIESADTTLPGEYYYLDDLSANDTVYSISKTCGEAWIAKFNDQDQKELRKTIDSLDKEHEDTTVSEKYSDTKSIRYENALLRQAILCEDSLTHTRGEKTLTTTAYKISFAAYCPEGNGEKGNHPYYRNRLIVQFDYMFDGPHGKEVFHLDDLEEYDSRRPKPLAPVTPTGHSGKGKKKKVPNPSTNQTIDNAKALNNGLLCPTYCPKP